MMIYYLVLLRPAPLCSDLERQSLRLINVMCYFVRTLFRTYFVLLHVTKLIYFLYLALARKFAVFVVFVAHKQLAHVRA